MTMRIPILSTDTSVRLNTNTHTHTSAQTHTRTHTHTRTRTNTNTSTSIHSRITITTATRQQPRPQERRRRDRTLGSIILYRLVLPRFSHPSSTSILLLFPFVEGQPPPLPLLLMARAPLHWRRSVAARPRRTTMDQQSPPEKPKHHWIMDFVCNINFNRDKRFIGHAFFSWYPA